MKDEQTEQFQHGMMVKVRELNRSYEIIDGPNRKQEYLLRIGNAQSWIHASRLVAPTATRRAKQREFEKKRKKTVTQPIIRRRTPEQTQSGVLKIDLHGMNVNEALHALENAIDRALLENYSEVEVIHGKGTGALKTATHSYLATCSHISRYELDSLNPGTTRIWI